MSRKKVGGGNVPSYLLHRPTGQAYCRVRQPDGSRKHVYLGPHNSPESRRRYREILADLDAVQAGAPTPEPDTDNDTTIAELAARFLLWAEPYYRKDGKPTRELPNFTSAAAPLLALYRDELAQDFTPGKLRRVRDEMLAKGWNRNHINKQVSRLRMVFRWRVEHELVSPVVHQALECVAGLRKGRSEAPEPTPVRPVSWEHVEATLPHLSRPVRGMVSPRRGSPASSPPSGLPPASDPPT